ncbi:MAG: ATP-binding protein [Opitutia bacterium]|jgi:predicted AAA+ superfamily ATPase
MILSRPIEEQIRRDLRDTRVVLLAGPRQAGKTTLAKKIAGKDMKFLTLDDPTTLAAAQADPVAFLRGLDRAVIDEVQRAPGLLVALKQSVDEDPRPGRFLLTGSANLMMLPKVADSLAGRMSVIDLLPLSAAEIHRRSGGFLEKAFKGATTETTKPVIGDDLRDLVLAGGYPEARARATWRRQQAWCLDYAKAIVERDVREVAQVDKFRELPRMLRALAHHSGQLVNHSKLSASLGLTSVTAQRYTGIFEQLYLLRHLPSWSGGGLARLTRTPKLHFLDSGLLAALRGVTPASLDGNRTEFGAVLETFVYSELLKQAGWEDGRFVFSHFRDKEHHEVDIVVEDDTRGVVGIEVKASATVTPKDFAGLRLLAEATGKRFRCGIVLYDGKVTLPFGDRLWAAPIASLWQA